MPTGPRIVFKDDRDSSIGRGAVLYAGHFLPEVSKIILVAALTAPDFVGNTMVVSEAYRNIRETRDLHRELRAFDFSLNGLLGGGTWEERMAVGEAWALRMRQQLGPLYQYRVHGTGSNLHLHYELDP